VGQGPPPRRAGRAASRGRGPPRGARGPKGAGGPGLGSPRRPRAFARGAFAPGARGRGPPGPRPGPPGPRAVKRVVRNRGEQPGGRRLTGAGPARAPFPQTGYSFLRGVEGHAPERAGRHNTRHPGALVKGGGAGRPARPSGHPGFGERAAVPQGSLVCPGRSPDQPGRKPGRGSGRRGPRARKPDVPVKWNSPGQSAPAPRSSQFGPGGSAGGDPVALPAVSSPGFFPGRPMLAGQLDRQQPAGPAHQRVWPPAGPGPGPGAGGPGRGVVTQAGPSSFLPNKAGGNGNSSPKTAPFSCGGWVTGGPPAPVR